MDFRFGIEHETAFLRPNGQFADFTNTLFLEFEKIVRQLPRYEQDYDQLRIGDAGIKLKRWYVEGFERFDLMGNVIDCPPKGIEIRTTVHDGVDGIDGAIAQLTESFDLLRTQAATAGFTPALVSFNPYRSEFRPDPPLNAFEQQRRQASPEMQTAHIPMLTQGPDLNLSVAGMSPQQMIDIGRKLTYYSPFIIPFSYSSPFYQGKTWSGLSVRTFYRTGARPAAMVFVEHKTDLIDSVPSLTQIARLPAEVGRIEFKAFDSCGDFELYASLCALLKGLVLDDTLMARLSVPDAKLHQRSARWGFADEEIYGQAVKVVDAADTALVGDRDQKHLHRLKDALRNRHSPAKDMLNAYEQGHSIEQILRQGYPATHSKHHWPKADKSPMVVS
ncbi:MAG: glutamate--cysteine ligase [Phormidesmis sp.]